MPTIRELLQGHRDNRGESYREMAERASKAGFPIRHQTLYELAHETPKGWPRDVTTIRAIATITGTSERAVVLAYAKSLGIRVDINTGARLIDLMPAGVDEIPPGMQDAILQIIREARNAAVHTTPPAQARTAEQAKPTRQRVRDVLRQAGLSDEDIDAMDDIAEGDVPPPGLVEEHAATEEQRQRGRRRADVGEDQRAGG